MAATIMYSTFFTVSFAVRNIHVLNVHAVYAFDRNHSMQGQELFGTVYIQTEGYGSPG